jgi:hypothetical protein
VQRLADQVADDPDASEHVLEHMAGYRGSAAVRVKRRRGTGQHDVLGEALDEAHLLQDRADRTERSNDAAGRCPSQSRRRQLAGAGRRRCGRPGTARAALRQLPGDVLGALHRGTKRAPRLGEKADARTWANTRDEIRAAVLEGGWSDRTQTFTGALDSDQLGASVLMLPLVDFLLATDSGCAPPSMRLKADPATAQSCAASRPLHANDLGLLAEEVDLNNRRAARRLRRRSPT